MTNNRFSPYSLEKDVLGKSRKGVIAKSLIGMTLLRYIVSHYRGILVDTICLISIRNSVSDGAKTYQF